jgi:hypothetical protein
MSLSATVAFIVLLTKGLSDRHNDWNPEKLKLGFSFDIVLKKQVLTIEHSIREEVDPVPQDKHSRRSTQHQFKLLRTMFHSRTLQTLFSAIHPRWSIDLGLNWAKHSRLKREGGKEPDYMGENKEFLVLYTKEYLKSHPNINFFIYGHRHIELDLMLSFCLFMI